MMMWNEKGITHLLCPPNPLVITLPVESASDHVTCDRMLGVLSGRWLKTIPPNIVAACFSFEFWRRGCWP